MKTPMSAIHYTSIGNTLVCILGTTTDQGCTFDAVVIKMNRLSIVSLHERIRGKNLPNAPLRKRREQSNSSELQPYQYDQTHQ